MLVLFGVKITKRWWQGRTAARYSQRSSSWVVIWSVVRQKQQSSTKLAEFIIQFRNGCKRYMLNLAFMLEQVRTMRLWPTLTWTAACPSIAIVTMHHWPILWDVMHCRPWKETRYQWPHYLTEKRSLNNCKCCCTFSSHMQKNWKIHKQWNSKGALQWL